MFTCNGIHYDGSGMHHTIQPIDPLLDCLMRIGPSLKWCRSWALVDGKESLSPRTVSAGCRREGPGADLPTVIPLLNTPWFLELFPPSF